ncbi:MAG: UDP-3-O-acyl-N-acetylglucosamine deacetylase [bacterium]
MINKLQKTIKSSVEFSGIGLHTGIPVKMVLKPAYVNSGINFVRVDLPNCPVITASYKNIKDTRFATTIGNSQCSIQTIEHLLAAFAGLGINNITVEIDGPEIPAMDGSAYPFVFILQQKTKIIEQEKRVSTLLIKRPILVGDKDKHIIIKPCPNNNMLTISYTIDFNHKLLRHKTVRYEINKDAFINKIAKARTFGFLEEVEFLRSNGLAKGGSLENAVVLDKEKVVNGDLRFKDELPCHKVLDLLGDLSLLGYAIIGEIKAYKAGHALHAELMEAILSTPKNYELTKEGDIVDDRFKITNVTPRLSIFDNINVPSPLQELPA